MRGWRQRLWVLTVVAVLLAPTACAPAAAPAGGSSSTTPAGSGASAPGAAAGAAAAAPGGAGPAPASSGDPGNAVLSPPERLRVAYTAPAGGYLPLWVAHDAGLFQKRGLDVELLVTAGGAQAVQVLLANEIDVAIADGAAVVRAGLGGGETTIFAVSTNTFALSLLAGPNVRRPEDLRGRRLGISRVGASSDFAARYLLRQWGFTPDVDVALVQTGSQPDMLRGLVAGVVDAGITGDPTSFQAVKEGFVELVDFRALGVEYAMYSVASLKSTFRERPAALRAFTAAYVEAIAWAHRHRAETLDILAKYTRWDDRELLGMTYDLYITRYLLRAPYPTAVGIQTVLDAIRDDEPRAAQAAPGEFYDDRFVRELDESGYIRRLYE